MATNRYSNGSVSRFNPMSFQEVMFAPSMMRQKHDGSIAAAEAMRLKADPLDVHYNRALQLKQEMDSKISSEVDRINKEGFNPNTTQNITRLNREYQDQIAPTGEIGQINAAKQVYAANLKEYLDDATKNKGWSRERALNNWQNKFANKYTGFGEDGKSIENIGQYGAPKYIDIAERVQNYAKEAGMTTKEWSNAMGNLSFDKTGNRYVVNANQKGLNADNIRQLRSVAETLNREIMNPNHEVRRSIDFDGQDPRNVLNDAVNQLGIYKDTKSSRGQGYSIGSVDWVKQEALNGNLDAVNVEGVSVTRNADLLSQMNGGSALRSRTPEEIKKEGNPLGGSVLRLDITDKKAFLKSQPYLKLAKAISRTNGLKGAYDSEETEKAVRKYLEENRDVTVHNRYVDVNSKPSDLLFASKENIKDKNAASNSLKERVMTGAYDMVDEEGNVIDGKSIGNHKIVYNGDMSAKSVVKNKKNGQSLFFNPKQNIGLRRASLIDKDGNSKIVYISRGSDDFETPQFKALEVISGVSKIADTQPGIYHEIKSPFFDSYGMKNVEVKYNKNKKTYNIRYINSDGVFTNNNGPENKDGTYDGIPDDQFQKYVLDGYTELYKQRQ